MKKQLCLIIFILSLILSLVGCQKVLSTSTYSVENEVKKVTLEDTACDIVFKTTEEEKLYFEYSELENKYTYVITMNNQTGSLVIKRKDNRKGFMKGSFTTTPKTTVFVPKDSEIDLDIKCTTGKINLNDIKIKDATVNLTTGDITIDNIKGSGSFELKSTSGKIKLSNSEINDFSSDLHAGEYLVENSAFSEKIKLVGYASAVELKDIDSENINVEITTGDFEYKNAEVKKVLSVTVTTGDINVSLTGKKADYTVTKKTGMGEKEVVGSGPLIVNLVTTVGTVSVEYLK